MAIRQSRQRTRRRPLVGARIRRLRTDRGLTLSQMGDRTGLNVGYLSQIETDKASPSLETLAALADALEVPISWCLEDAAPPPRLVRARERRAETHEGLRVEEVDGGHARNLRVVEAILAPGARTSLKTDAGEEHHLVLSGTIRLRQGAFTADLAPGDYVVWDGTFPHEGENIGGEPTRVLIITAGPSAAVVAPDLGSGTGVSS